jgi:Domain of unknown function (DUF1844)
MADTPEINFEHFLFSLSTSALLFLGEIPHPETKEKKVDLGQARQSIEILGMLREKTKGNLTPGEQTLLDGMLSELRLRFVSLSTKPAG